MPNMSYCRFRNTLSDLRDCYYNMEGVSSNDEKQAREQLVKLCKDIINEYGDLEFNDNEDDEWGFNIVELERGEEDKDNDDIPWDTQTR